MFFLVLLFCMCIGQHISSTKSYKSSIPTHFRPHCTRINWWLLKHLNFCTIRFRMRSFMIDPSIRDKAMDNFTDSTRPTKSPFTYFFRNALCIKFSLVISPPLSASGSVYDPIVLSTDVIYWPTFQWFPLCELGNNLTDSWPLQLPVIIVLPNRFIKDD